MEKKEYITPETEVIELEPTSMIAASIGVSDETTDDGAVMSNGRRGNWGDLWSQGEE